MLVGVYPEDVYRLSRLDAHQPNPVPARDAHAEFFQRDGSEAQCARAVERTRWPDGFRCPRCGESGHYRVIQDARELFQCPACRRQTALTAGTMMSNTKLPLRVWFLTMYLIS